MPQTNASTVTCPKCGEPIELTEALAAPVLANARAELAARERENEQRSAAERATAQQQQRALEEARASLQRDKAALEQRKAEEDRRIAQEVAKRTDQQLVERLVVERRSIAETEARRAQERVAETLAERDRDNIEMRERMNALTAKLTASQAAEAQLRRKEQELADKEREFELKLEQEVSGRVEQIRAVAATEAEQRLSLQLNDKDRTIRELASKLEEASRKAQQGSQQAQGETLELVLEDQLRRNFPFDELQPVPKGEFGGDTLHVVRDGSGRECGRILWEFKRTKNWDAKWLPKLRGDQRAARADIAVIVSQAMPPDVLHFNEVDGVWVSSLACTLPVATALRSSLMQLAGQRRNAEGQQTKSELIYAYLTGPQFRGRIEAIAERWQEMQNDLITEKKQTMTRWAKREKQLETLLHSTTGIWGDLQGIAGRDMAEIQALEDTLLLGSEG